MKFPVKNAEIVRKLSVLASSSSQTQGFDRILKIFIKSLFFIKLEVNDDKTGLLFVPLSTLSKPEGTHHPLALRFVPWSDMKYVDPGLLAENLVMAFMRLSASIL